MMRTDQSNFIRRLKRGKEEALEYVVDSYLPLVKGIAAKVLSPLGAEGLVEECVNDIFFSVWKHADQFEGEDPEQFRRWLCGVSRYRAIDFYRRERQRRFAEPKASWEDWEAGGLSENTELLGEAESAEDEVILREKRSEIAAMLELLSPVDREIFLLKFFMGLKSEEISQRLGLSKSSVDNRIYRGRKKLMPQFGKTAVWEGNRS